MTAKDRDWEGHIRIIEKETSDKYETLNFGGKGGGEEHLRFLSHFFILGARHKERCDVAAWNNDRRIFIYVLVLDCIIWRSVKPKNGFKSGGLHDRHVATEAAWNFDTTSAFAGRQRKMCVVMAGGRTLRLWQSARSERFLRTRNIARHKVLTAELLGGKSFWNVRLWH
jgi:hypothetical protein